MESVCAPLPASAPAAATAADPRAAPAPAPSPASALVAARAPAPHRLPDHTGLGSDQEKEKPRCPALVAEQPPISRDIVQQTPSTNEMNTCRDTAGFKRRLLFRVRRKYNKNMSSEEMKARLLGPVRGRAALADEDVVTERVQFAVTTVFVPVRAPRGDGAGPLPDRVLRAIVGDPAEAFSFVTRAACRPDDAPLDRYSFTGGEEEARAVVAAAARVRAGLAALARRGAELRGAELRGAELRGAELRGAVLRGAELRGAELRGAELRGAELRGAAPTLPELRALLPARTPRQFRELERRLQDSDASRRALAAVFSAQCAAAGVRGSVRDMARGALRRALARGVAAQYARAARSRRDHPRPFSDTNTYRCLRDVMKEQLGETFELDQLGKIISDAIIEIDVLSNGI